VGTGEEDSGDEEGCEGTVVKRIAAMREGHRATRLSLAHHFQL